MKIISWNVNGLRAVYKRGFLDWLKKTDADIVCLQEIKIQKEQIPSQLANPENYYSYFNLAKRKGYSGVTIYSKRSPLSAEQKMGLARFDEEGRMLRLDYPEFVLINFYLPHGGRNKENLCYKLKVYGYLFKYLGKLKNRKIVLVGDFNIAHKEIDLARPKQNQNNVMFTPEERETIEKLIKLGFIDSFRQFHKEGGNYTWWPYFASARQRNLGWRIDYVFISKELSSKLKNAFILFRVKGSDHCPIGIEV